MEFPQYKVKFEPNVFIKCVMFDDDSVWIASSGPDQSKSILCISRDGSTKTFDNWQQLVDSCIVTQINFEPTKEASKERSKQILSKLTPQLRINRIKQSN